MVYHDAKYRWRPQYRVDGRQPFSVNVPRCDECPVSFITPESQQLVQLEQQMRVAKEAGGATWFGPNLNQWPAAWLDAVQVMEAQRQSYIDAMTKAKPVHNNG